MRYLAQTLITLTMLALSTHSYAQCGAPILPLCDANGDLVVDVTDIELISAAKGTPADPNPGDVRDADMDGTITVLDARHCAEHHCDSPIQCTDVLTSCAGTEVDPDRLFLQQLGSDSVIIKWRGNQAGGAEAENVCFGTDENDLQLSSKTWATTTATDHREVLLSGLTPDTTYYYSVGGAGIADTSHHFRTAPAVGGNLPPDGNTRIWIVGDSGVAGVSGSKYEEGAGFVRDGFNTWVAANGGEPADLFLMLGDNAYSQGTDAEHQLAIFDVYSQILASTPLWPTIGNHEMGFGGLGVQTSTDDYEVFAGQSPGGADPSPPDSPMPYLNIFTLPTAGEIGGLLSGTEQYYSFDYANVHIVSLDSQVAIRDTANRTAMKNWLIGDLQAHNQDWTIVIFHHPPYSKGSHDSDNFGSLNNDQPIFHIREEFTPLFEDYGVDLAYAGHSHIYERSFYIKGHTGLSGTFYAGTTAVPGMAELNAAGDPGTGQDPLATDTNPPYTQISTGSGMDDRVVYTVAGNGGKATGTKPGYPHPAHFYSEEAGKTTVPVALPGVPAASGDGAIGSVVIDLGANSLRATFIDHTGAERDYFTMTR